MADEYYFNGRTYTTPTVASSINDNAEIPDNVPTGNTIAFVGPSVGGIPGVPVAFGDPNTPANVLISGYLLQAIQKSFAVSDDDVITAPTKVYAVPVISASSTQGSIKINGYTLPTAVYGSTTAGILVEVEPGSVAGFAVGVQYNGKTSFQDNVYDTPFTIFNNNTAGFSFSVTGSTFSGTIAGGTAQTFSLLGAGGAYLTLAQFVAAFNSTFVGTGIYAVAGNVSGGLNSSTPINQCLDVMTAPQTVAASGSLAVISKMNALLNYLVSTGVFTYKVGAATQPQAPWSYAATGVAATPAYNFGYTQLGQLTAANFLGTAGVDGTITNNDWAVAFTALQRIDVQWITPLSVSPAVWAMGDAHVQYMSSLGRERRQIAGPDFGTSIAAVQAMGQALNSNRTAIAYPGYYDYNAAGVLTLYQSMFTAALATAGFGGMPPGEPLTYKTFTVYGWEVKLQNPLDTDGLIQSGVMPFIKDTAGYICARSVSTWLQDNKYDKVELSVGFASDEVARTVRQAAKPFLGGQQTPQALSRALVAAEAQLNYLATPAPTGPGLIVGDDTNPPWSNLQGSIAADATSITFNCQPVLPTNFIGVGITIAPYSGTQTIAAS